MKKIIILLVFSFICFINSFSQEIYKDYGIWQQTIDNNSIVSVKAYVTKTYTQIDYRKGQQKGYLPKYRYELILVSLSKHYGNLTKTWLYDNKKQ